jgi:hypothetical protein
MQQARRKGEAPAAAIRGAPLYKLPAANAVIAYDKRRRAIVAWSGMYNFKDVSGTGTMELRTGERMAVECGRRRPARFVPRDVSSLRQRFDCTSEAAPA